MTIANDLLQLRMDRAARMTGRMVLNSTVGLGGIINIAAKHGLPEQKADFGQTLSRYGVGPGPFLVLPIIGPEPPRDLLGDTADLFVDPLTWLPAGWPLFDRVGLTTGVHVWDPYLTHARNMLLRKELEKGSLDPYATMRSISRQLREDEIEGGDGGSGELIFANCALDKKAQHHHHHHHRHGRPVVPATQEHGTSRLSAVYKPAQTGQKL